MSLGWEATSYLTVILDFLRHYSLCSWFNLYGIAANVFFIGGWLAELIVRKIWPLEADRFATLSFFLGLIFSVALTLTPAIVVSAAGIFGLVGHLLGVSHTHPL